MSIRPEISEYNNENIIESSTLNTLLDKFEPITLAQMDKVRLMNRVDTKYILNYCQLLTVLKNATSLYKILEIEGKRSALYSSIYYDTEDVQMYRMHHNGKLNRYKIRMRSYVNSGDVFLEVKRKNNKGRTSKKRIKIAREHFENLSFDEMQKEFIKDKTPFEYEKLSAQLQNMFNRVTLVDFKESERVTLDLGLNFMKVGCDQVFPMDKIIIVEVKQDGAVSSSFKKLLDEASVSPKRISKYCLGMIITNPEIKYNRFKEKIRLINKITTYDSIRTSRI